MAEQRMQDKSQKKYRPWELKKHDAEILEMRLGGATLEAIATHFETTKESIRNAVARQLLANAQQKAPIQSTQESAA